MDVIYLLIVITCILMAASMVLIAVFFIRDFYEGRALRKLQEEEWTAYRDERIVREAGVDAD